MIDFIKTKKWIWYLIPVLLFLLLKVPYLSYDFGQPLHADKYGTYIPNAVAAYDAGNPFHNFNPNLVNIYDQQQESAYQDFSELPVYHFSFFAVNQLTSSWSPEATVLLINTVLGSVTLVCLMLLLTNILQDKQSSIIAGTFLAISPFFQHFTFLTVTDMPALLFTLIGWLLLTKGRHNAAFWFVGLAIVSKLSFILIAPVFLVIYGLWQNELSRYDLITLLGMIVVHIASFRLLLSPAANQDSALVSIVLTLLYLLAVAAISQLGKAVKLASQSKYRQLVPLLLGAVVCIAAIVMSIKLSEISTSFLPDDLTIFWRPEVYTKFASDILFMTSSPILLLILLGIGIAVANYRKLLLHRYTHLIVPLMITSLIYFIGGIVPIYFHYYYKHIFFITLNIIAALTFNYVTRNMRASYVNLFVGVTALLHFGSYDQFILNDRIFYDLDKVAAYMDVELDLNYKVLRLGRVSKVIPIYNQQIQLSQITGFTQTGAQRVRDDINADGGLREFLVNHEVRYLISEGPADFKQLGYLVDPSVGPESREDLITTDQNSTTPPELETRIRSTFVPIDIINGIYIYEVLGYQEYTELL